MSTRVVSKPAFPGPGQRPSPDPARTSGRECAAPRNTWQTHILHLGLRERATERGPFISEGVEMTFGIAPHKDGIRGLGGRAGPGPPSPRLLLGPSLLGDPGVRRPASFLGPVVRLPPKTHRASLPALTSVGWLVSVPTAFGAGRLGAGRPLKTVPGFLQDLMLSLGSYWPVGSSSAPASPAPRPSLSPHCFRHRCSGVPESPVLTAGPRPVRPHVPTGTVWTHELGDALSCRTACPLDLGPVSPRRAGSPGPSSCFLHGRSLGMVQDAKSSVGTVPSRNLQCTVPAWRRPEPKGGSPWSCPGRCGPRPAPPGPSLPSRLHTRQLPTVRPGAAGQGTLTCST